MAIVLRSTLPPQVIRQFNREERRIRQIMPKPEAEGEERTDGQRQDQRAKQGKRKPVTGRAKRSCLSDASQGEAVLEPPLSAGSPAEADPIRFLPVAGDTPMLQSNHELPRRELPPAPLSHHPRPDEQDEQSGRRERQDAAEHGHAPFVPQSLLPPQWRRCGTRAS